MSEAQNMHISSARHWADWRHSGSGNDIAGLFLSKTAQDFIKDIAHAAESFEEGNASQAFTTDKLNRDDLDAVIQFFGEGECKVSLSSVPDTGIIETSFAGIWKISAESISFEVGSIPQRANEILKNRVRSSLEAIPPEQGESMALATITDIISELKNWKKDRQVRGINLSNIPYPPEAQKEIVEWLGDGGVSFETTGAFASSVALSRFYPAWYCCFYDAKGSIRNAGIEFTGIPETIAAPVEDIVNSGQRILSSFEDGVEE